MRNKTFLAASSALFLAAAIGAATAAPQQESTAVAPWSKSLLEKAAHLRAEAAKLALVDGAASADMPMPKNPLRKGSKGADVELFCSALAARGIGECPQGAFGSEHEKLAKKAQSAAGLQPDGLPAEQLYLALGLGTRSKAAMAENAAAAFEKAAADSAAKNSAKAILVNIPSFMAYAYGPKGQELATKAIVGHPARQTPLDAMRAIGIKYNPDWTVPPGLLRREAYPALDGDGRWIKSHGLSMIDKSGQPIDIEGVSSQEAKELGYRFVQKAGAGAALGQLKFETDSRENIYLHDTNERHLFALASRARSSGCVRIQQWQALASWASGKSAAEIGAKVDAGKTAWERMDPIPVVFSYAQADIGEDGLLAFYPDIYQFSKRSGAKR